MASLADGSLSALSAYTQLTRLVASVAASLWTSLRVDRTDNNFERTPDTAHLVLFAYQAWGHARPLCNLASRLVQHRHVLITFFTTPAFYDRVKAELLRNLETEDARLDCANRIRLIALQHKGRHTLDNSVLNASFAEAFGNLVKGAPLQCAHTDTQYEAGPVPKTVILDFFALLPLRAVRRLSSPERPVKVFVWFAGAASVIFRLVGPERLGGVGDLPAKSADKAVREQVDVAQAAGDIVLGSEGIVVHIPGLPPIFDYEVEPQIIPARALTGAMCLAAHETITCCDGIILASPECYEPDTTSALRQWMAEKSRPVYCVGPMIPRIAFVNAVEKRQSDCAVEIDDFLTSTLDRQGAGTLLYISFGTVHWSAEPEKVWAFLKIVIENQIPFIMSHASLKTSIPPDIVDKVRGSGRGLLIPYSPQQHILSHPATGWFLTHGGHNSVMEAVCAGVPMIFWPFTFDQPLNAIHLTSLGVAYELFNGRTGPGLRPIHRLGKAPVGTLNAVREEAKEVLRAAFGEDGQRKRARLQALRQAVRDARSVRGSSSREIKALVDSF